MPVKKWRPGMIHLAALIFYALLTVVMTWPLSLNLTQAIPGDSFDGWQNYWNLWWMKVALLDQTRSPYFTDLLYHPTGVSLHFHTLNSFNGLVTLPVQLTAGLIPAYNAVVFLSWVLGGYGVYLLTLWILRRGSAFFPAFLAGVIFTFSPFHMAHLLGHMQVMSLQWIPFYGLYLLRALDHSEKQRSWRRDALLAALFLILAGLCDWYFALYLFFFTSLAVLWRSVWVVKNWRLESLTSIIIPPLIIWLVFLLILSPVLAPMMREAVRFSFMVRPLSDLYIFSASFIDFLSPNRLHPLFRSVSSSWIGNQIAPISERMIGVGYTPMLLAGVAFWLDRRRAAFWLAVLLFFLSLALGPRLHLGNITWEDIPTNEVDDGPVPGWTPFAILNRVVPFMRISRSVSRYALMVELSVAVLAGMGLHAWIGRLARRRAGNIAALLSLALVLAEFWTAPYLLSPPDTPAFYARLPFMPGKGALLNLPMNYDRPGYLLYQTVHRRPLTVAYISREDPRTLTERVPILQHFRRLGPDILQVDPAAVGMTVLHDLDIGVVALDRYKMPAGLERDYTTRLAQAIFAGRPPIYEDERLTVFAVEQPVTPQPYGVLGELNWGPLKTDEQGIRSRPLGEGPAELRLVHLPPGAQLRIRYRTLPNVGMEIGSPDLAERLAALPAAPNGQEINLDLDALPARTDALTLTFLAETAQGVEIETLTLITP